MKIQTDRYYTPEVYDEVITDADYYPLPEKATGHTESVDWEYEVAILRTVS